MVYITQTPSLYPLSSNTNLRNARIGMNAPQAKCSFNSTLKFKSSIFQTEAENSRTLR